MDAQQRRLELKQLIEKIGTFNSKILGVGNLAEKYNVNTKTIFLDIKTIKEESGINYSEQETGIIAIKDILIDGEEIEQIWIGYDDDGTNSIVPVPFFPNRQIANISKVFENIETGEIEDRIVKKGMSREELERFFPARKSERKKFGYKYNLRELIRSAIYEAYKREGLTVEMKDLSQEIKDAMEETERELDEVK